MKITVQFIILAIITIISGILVYCSLNVFFAYNEINSYFSKSSVILCEFKNIDLLQNEQYYTNMIANHIIAEKGGFLDMNRFEIESYYIAAALIGDGKKKYIIKKIPCLRRV